MSLKAISSSGNMFSVSVDPLEGLYGLEREYAKSCFPDQVDTSTCLGFPDFLTPNEANPERVKPHLMYHEKGFLVSTGTERSFFDLIFSDPKMCMGLVNCDINPRVKAYIDFNVLLLRISDCKEEYEELSSTTKSREAFEERIHLINDKIQSSTLTGKVRGYYQQHIYDFGSVYLKLSKSWRYSVNFCESSYYDNDAFFSTLKSYAESGNIISLTRNINDLTFMGNKTVSVVDVSNIPHYCILDLKGETNFHPRVIWTDFVKPKGFWYQSYMHETLNDHDSSAFDQALSRLKKATFVPKKYPHGDEYALWLVIQQRAFSCQDNFFADVGAIRSNATTKFLKKYCKKNLFEMPRSVLVNMNARNIEKFNDYSRIALTMIFQNEKIQEFTYHIVKAWQSLNPEVISVLGETKWNDKLNVSFEKYFCSHSEELPLFLEKMDKALLLDKFIFQFGKAKLIQLIKDLRIGRSIPASYFEELKVMDYHTYMASIQFDF